MHKPAAEEEITSLHDLSAVDLIAGYRAKQFSPSEVLEEVIGHVAAWEPHIKALYLFDPDGARATAKASTDRWQRDEPAGALDGVRALIRERMRTICAGIAATYQCEITADIRDTFSVLVNEEEQSRVVEAVAKTVVDPANVLTRATPKMGSEDFADMMQVVPGAYFWIGHDGSVPVHNPGYFLDDKILPIGASMFARIIETRLPVGSHA